MKTKQNRPQDRGYAAASMNFRDGLARICRLYGASPLLGDLYAILFLATEPVALEDLCHGTGAAKSTVSVALRKLLSLRVVRRLASRGDRRDFYEAVTDPWALVEEWTRLFIRPEIEMWRGTGGELERSLAAASDAPKGARKAEIHGRLRQMFEFADLFERFLGSMTVSRAPRSLARTIPIDVEGKR